MSKQWVNEPGKRLVHCGECFERLSEFDTCPNGHPQDLEEVTELENLVRQAPPVDPKDFVAAPGRFERFQGYSAEY